MNNDEVLKQCIKIAVDNGFDVGQFYDVRLWYEGYNVDFNESSWYIPYEGHGVDLEALLFNHSFCKSLFGDEVNCDKDWYDNRSLDARIVMGKYEDLPKKWEYHIKQLALSIDRIQYLREWLEKQ